MCNITYRTCLFDNARCHVLYKIIISKASRKINPFSARSLGDVALGFVNEKNEIHCGNNYYMDKVKYDEEVNKACAAKPKDQYCKFVKNVTSTIVGLEALKNCSVTGRKCNRLPNTTPKQKIDPDKLSTVYGIFEYFLTNVKKVDPIEIEIAQTKVG
ncbi:uncharacterized protein LOC103317086 [Nasonia vitripennis]|uniref:BEN domain-containing protein n=1 Tax=Nasonia vitripennis TaxID=7425 RepID=A0A7M7Q4X1_NASVI|nr:uncharacterized protein LOC103317086 [Nasonia vitripennis]